MVYWYKRALEASSFHFLSIYMSVGRIFSGGAMVDFPGEDKDICRGAIMVKFHFSHSKLRNPPFLQKN